MTFNTTDDLGANWSPDGRTIAFYGTQFGPDAEGRIVAIAPPNLFLIDVESRSQRLLTPVRGRFPSWSPDGRRIAFDNGGPTGGDILVINVDGSGLQQLTDDFSARNIGPDWSPDGRHIAFTSRRDGNDEIYVMNVDGGGLRRLTTWPGRDLDADWSPNGRTIAFERDIEPISARTIQVFVIDADTPNAGALPLTALPSENGHPGWGHGRVVKPDK